MSKKRKAAKSTPKRKPTPDANYIDAWLERGDQQTPSVTCGAVIASLLLKRPEYQQKCEEHLEKWLNDCLSPEGISDLVSCGFDDELAALVDVFRQSCKDKSGR